MTMVTLGCAVVLITAIGAWGLGGKSHDPDPVVPSSAGTVEVTRRTLKQTAALDGTLNHGPETTVTLRATGTITWLPPAGSTVRRGDELLRVDDHPVVLLYGSIPMYRPLGTPTTTTSPATEGDSTSESPQPAPSTTPTTLTGRDVKQFESNLRALGFSGFTVDATFSAQTAEAVKRWQHDLGMPRTGAVEVGDVVFAKGKVRVSRAIAKVGSPATGDVVSYTAFTRRVTVKAPAGDTSWAAPGTKVDVVLPDAKVVAGTVKHVGTIASAPVDGGEDAGSDEQSSPAVPILIDIADQDALGTLEGGPVTVRHVVKERADVLTVPVTALVALAEGGYGLQVADASVGTGRFIPVTTGLFADGMVEVSGVDLREGMTVRSPQ